MHAPSMVFKRREEYVPATSLEVVLGPPEGAEGAESAGSGAVGACSFDWGCGLGAWGSLTGHAARSAKVTATLDTRPQVPRRCFEGPSGETDAAYSKHARMSPNRPIPSHFPTATGPRAHPRPRNSSDDGPH